jgi:biotin transport system substrate-specific component
MGAFSFMLRSKTLVMPQLGVQLLRIALFTALIAISARVRIELPGLPPITGQTFMIYLTAMLIGPKEGLLSVLVYLGLIAVGAPLDARGLGAAALVGPTAGYLLGFIPGVFVAGLMWRAARLPLLFNFLCGLAAAVVILSIGAAGTALASSALYGATWGTIISTFIVIEAGKALLAASLAVAGGVAAQRLLKNGITG